MNVLRLMLYIRTAWSDYYTESLTTFQSNEYGALQTPSGTNGHLLNYVFRSITSTSNGGGLSCISVTYLLIESTSFFSCKTSGQRSGAIYFSMRYVVMIVAQHTQAVIIVLRMVSLLLLMCTIPFQARIMSTIHQLYDARM